MNSPEKEECGARVRLGHAKVEGGGTFPQDGTCANLKPCPLHPFTDTPNEKREEKITTGAKDFAERFEPIMKELAEEESMSTPETVYVNSTPNPCPACEQVKREGDGFCSSHTPFLAGDGVSMTMLETKAFIEKLGKEIKTPTSNPEEFGEPATEDEVFAGTQTNSKFPFIRNQSNPHIAVLDRVKKITGNYSFEGTVVSVFQTLAGKTRYVVEHDGTHMLHIFNETQLEKNAMTPNPEEWEKDVRDLCDEFFADNIFHPKMDNKKPLHPHRAGTTHLVTIIRELLASERTRINNEWRERLTPIILKTDWEHNSSEGVDALSSLLEDK